KVVKSSHHSPVILVETQAEHRSSTLRPLPEMRMMTTWTRCIGEFRQLKLAQLAMAAAASLALALSLAACQNVAGFTQPSLVRVIDASYIAPAVNVYVEKTLFAGNIGEGYISNYGTVSPAPAAQIQVTQATGGKSLVAAAATLNAGAQH